MKFREKKLHCSEHLLENLKIEISEINQVISTIHWREDFSILLGDDEHCHQRAYNKAFEIEFLKLNWLNQPKLNDTPKLIGDFGKGMAFVEVQFGNSATLYRDYYKFQYGLQKGLLSLAVLIVPDDEYEFFPTRRKSVNNMANFKLAERYCTVLPINVPVWIIGLKPEN